MYILKRFSTYLIPVLWILGLELVRLNTSLILPFVIVFFVYLIFVIWFLGKSQKNKSFLNFLILPIAFCFSSFIFVLFMSNQIVFHCLVVGSGVILYLLIKQYLIFFNFPFKYQPYTLESLSFYTSLFIFFTLFSSGFAGYSLLKLPIWLIISVILIVMFFVLYQFFWIHKIEIKKSWLFVLFICLVLIELAISLSYLPISYYINAFIITIFSYLMLGFSKLFLKEILDKKNVISYLSVGGVLLLLVLLTAQWG